jgi:hypothetical protein
VPAVIGRRGRPGRPRKRPAKLHADNGYDFPGRRRLLRHQGICPRIARRGVESNTWLGRYRLEVERSLAWLLANRRLTVRHERRTDILMTFLHLGCALICGRNATRAANDVDHSGAAAGSGGGRICVLGR